MLSEKSGSRRSIGTGTKNSIFFGQHQALSRSHAIRQVKKSLTKKDHISPDALRLILLFHIGVEELTESGVPYEMVRALEKRHPLLFNMN